MSIKCKIVQIDIDTKKNINTYWLQTLEAVYPYKLNEYLITDDLEQLKFNKMSKETKWQKAETTTTAPAIIWFHKKTLVERIFNLKILPYQTKPVFKKLQPLNK